MSTLDVRRPWLRLALALVLFIIAFAVIRDRNPEEDHGSPTAALGSLDELGRLVGSGVIAVAGLVVLAGALRRWSRPTN